MTTNLLTPPARRHRQRRTDRLTRLRTAYNRVRPRVELRSRGALQRFWEAVNATVMARLAKAGGHPHIDELIHAGEIHAPFNRVMRPQWMNGIFSGFDFEYRWIKSDSDSKQALWLPSYVRQEIDPDEVEGPSTLVKMSPATERAIGDYLTTKQNTIWRDIWGSYQRRLRDTLADGLADGDTTDALQARVQAALRGYSAAGARRVARTETTGSMGHGQQAARTQAGIDKKEWDSAKDNRTRGSLSKKGRRSRFNHVAPDGQVRDNDKPFSVSGQSLMYPGDSSLGATAGNLCNCFMPGTVVQGSFDAAMRSVYRGQAVEIVTDGGAILRVTNNHPILTAHGFVAAGTLQEGDKLLRYVGEIDDAARRSFVFVPSRLPADEDYAPTRIEQIFGAFTAIELPKLCRNMPGNFHGDGEFTHGNIDVVRPDWELLIDDEPGFADDFRDGIFECCDPVTAGEVSCGSFDTLTAGMLATATCSPRLSALTLDAPPVSLQRQPFQGLRFGSAANIDASRFEDAGQSRSFDVQAIGHRLERFAGSVTADQFGDVAGLPCARGLPSDFRKPAALIESARFHSSGSEPLMQRPVADSDFLRQLLTGCPRVVSFDRIRQIKFFEYAGHVFDLQSPKGWIVAGGIFCSNCRCASFAHFED